MFFFFFYAARRMVEKQVVSADAMDSLLFYPRLLSMEDMNFHKQEKEVQRGRRMYDMYGNRRQVRCAMRRLLRAMRCLPRAWHSRRRPPNS